MRIPVTCLLACAAACASTKPQNRPRETTTTQRAQTLMPLTSAVSAMAASRGSASHQDIVVALRRLGDAIAALPASAEAGRIATSASRLEASAEDSHAHADLVERALRSTQRALEKRAANARTEVVTSVARLASAISAIDREEPLSDQRGAVTTALQAATNALALIRGEPPPFEAITATRPTIRPPDVALADARKHALALARSDWMDTSEIAARLVDDLASLVASYGDTAKVTQLHYRAQRLAGDRRGVLAEAAWIREALETAVAGLEEHTGTTFRDARDAVANIKTARTVAFQRAAIQDAVRATVSAFVSGMSREPTTTTAQRTP